MVIENRAGRELPQEPVNCTFRSLSDLFTIKPYLSHGRWQSVDLTVHSRRERSLGRGEPGIVGGDPNLALPQKPASSVTSGSVEIDLYAVAGDAQSTDTSGPPTGRQVVGSATLQLLFWGGFWEKAASPSTGDVTNAVAAILASPYLSQLDQYGFTGLTLGPSTLVYADVPSPTFRDVDAFKMVWDLIDQKTFPEPDEPGGRNVYMIFAPAGTQYNTGDRGAHNAAVDNDWAVDEFAWVGFVNYGSIDFITQVFSHELVEILTDPEPNSGFQMNRSLNGGTEIGDACNHTGARAEGILLQAYWSERHKACIVPRRRRTVSIVRSDPNNDLVFDHVTEHKQVTVTPGPGCPEGTYCYKRHARWESITFTAIPYRFNTYSVSWTLAGKPIPPNATGNVVFTTETQTPEPTSWSKATAPVTVNYQTTATSLTITNNPSDANYGFDVVAIASETDPPDPTATATATVSDGFQGEALQWDDQFKKDREQCVNRLRRSAEKALATPIPDPGDPYRPWVDRLPPVYNETTRGEIRELGRLAHYVQRVDPKLSAALKEAVQTLYQVPTGVL